MKLIFNISILLFSLNTYAGDDDFSVIGRPIQSPLKDQLCYLELKNNDDSTGTCSGVRISNDYVLTAEHCIRDSRGNKREISIDCNSNNLQIENIYESKEFLKTFALSHNGADDLPGQAFSAFDFALIKVKSKKIFVPKFKILKNLADYQSIFLNSSAAVSLNFAENTYCEFHGYGISGTRTSGKLHSTSILSTTLYKNMSYLMKIVPQEEIGQYLQSPFLPEDTKDKDWLYSTVRPGDSGGPIFCKTKNEEWILSGIASILEFGDCPELLQEPTDNKFHFFKPAKTKCNSNRWALPTIETLENLLKIRLDQL